MLSEKQAFGVIEYASSFFTRFACCQLHFVKRCKTQIFLLRLRLLGYRWFVGMLRNELYIVSCYSKLTHYLLKGRVCTTEQTKQKLMKITNILLKQEDLYGELKQAVDEFYELLIDLTGIDGNNRKNQDDILLPNGKAIGTLWAARCVREFMRTKRFVQGLHQAVVDAKVRFPGQRIRILYAGTGPFATLLLPLTTVFSSEEIACTLLEINPGSIAALHQVIARLELQDYVVQIVQCDATAYQPPNAPHIVVTEVMQNALKKEPQVAVTLNLVPQLLPGGILIPQQVRVDAAFVRFSEKEGVMHTTPQPVFCLNKETRLQNVQCTVAVDLSEGRKKGCRQLALLTTIRVYGQVELTVNQCSLTIPSIVKLYTSASQIPEQVFFRYLMGKVPHFEYYD